MQKKKNHIRNGHLASMEGEKDFMSIQTSSSVSFKSQVIILFTVQCQQCLLMSANQTDFKGREAEFILILIYFGLLSS